MEHETTSADTNSQRSPLSASPLTTKLGMHVVQASAAAAVLTMPVEGNTQIHGILHGGATAALCETAASLSAAAHAESLSPDLIAVGSELSISHLRAGQGSRVTAHATAIHLGRTSTVHEVRVTDDGGRLVSVARVTNRLIGR